MTRIMTRNCEMAEKARADADRIAALEQEFDRIAQLVTSLPLHEVEAFLLATGDEADCVRPKVERGSLACTPQRKTLPADQYQMWIDMDVADLSAWNGVWLKSDHLGRALGAPVPSCNPLPVSWPRHALSSDMNVHLHIFNASQWSGDQLLSFMEGGVERTSSSGQTLQLLFVTYQKWSGGSASSPLIARLTEGSCRDDGWIASFGEAEEGESLEAELAVPAFVAKKAEERRRKSTRKRSVGK